MIKSISAPLVGMFFRPPAKAILAHLPSSCPLEIQPEPENPHDENALQVFVKSTDIPPAQHEDLRADAAGMGFDLETILSTPEWHLGYIARAFAAQWAPAFSPGRTAAKLTFNFEGIPQVTIEAPANA
jgi:hypothetical protein